MSVPRWLREAWAWSCRSAARLKPVRRPAPEIPHRPSIMLRGPRLAALVAIAVLVASASLVSFAESYRGLYLWALHHELSGIWAAAFPAQIDVFIAVGELALFVALVDQWQALQRSAAWLVTIAGLAVSVAGNIGHITSHAFADRATAAVPPLAAASALAVGLGVLKRVVEKRQRENTADGTLQGQAPEPVPDTRPEQPKPAVATDAEKSARQALAASIIGGNPLSPNALQTKYRLTRGEAAKLHRELVSKPLAELTPAPSPNGDRPHE